MIRAQGLAARTALILTVLLAVRLIFTGLGSAGSENIRGAPIEDRGSPRAVKSGAQVRADARPGLTINRVMTFLRRKLCG